MFSYDILEHGIRIPSTPPVTDRRSEFQYHYRANVHLHGAVNDLLRRSCLFPAGYYPMATGSKPYIFTSVPKKRSHSHCPDLQSPNPHYQTSKLPNIGVTVSLGLRL